MTSSKTKVEAEKFISGLSLPEIEPGPAALSAGPDYSKPVFVDDASIIIFTPNVSLQNKQDVLNSMLLAQRAARVVDPGMNQPISYYNKYTEVLNNIGYAVGNWQFTDYTGSGSQLSVDKAIIDILTAVMTGTELTMVKTVIESLQNLQGDNGLTLFERESHSLNDGNFRIGVCDESAGVVGMKLGAFTFSSQSNITKILWFSWSSASANFRHQSQNVMLNEQVYSQVRNLILQRLGQAARDYVIDLPIAI